MSDPEPVDSSAGLHSVTVTAATPDVVGRLCKEIADRILSALPEGAIDNIVKDALNKGIIFVKNTKGWGESERTVFDITDKTKEVLASLLHRRVESILNQLWTKPETIDFIKEVSIKAFTEMMSALPYIASAVFTSQVTGLFNVAGERVSNDKLSNCMEHVAKLHRALVNADISIPD